MRSRPLHSKGATVHRRRTRMMGEEEFERTLSRQVPELGSVSDRRQRGDEQLVGGGDADGAGLMTAQRERNGMRDRRT